MTKVTQMTRAGAYMIIAAVVGLSLIPARAAAAACATPTVGSAVAADTTAKAYAAWKTAYVVGAGGDQLRVQRSEGDGYDTVSEGIAYGMLFAAYGNDKTTFDGLWRYAQAHLNGNGVMNWRIAANGATTGYNGATDADEDMAAALVAADTQWGGYRSDAVSLISTIKKYEVEAGSNVLKPGDAWGGSNLTNPSYLTPSYYGVFATYTGDTSWNAVKTASYGILNAIRSNTDAGKTGYVPDWSRADGYRADGMGYDYGYDGSRAPLRLALAGSWDCDQSAIGMLNTLNATNATLNLGKLASSYALDGSVTGYGDGTPLLAAAASAATASPDANLRATGWNTLAAAPSRGYFADSMRLFGLFVAGGTFVSPLTLKPVTPVTSPAPAAPKTYAMTGAATTAVTGSATSVTVGVSAPTTVMNALVDLEVYDASGARVTQRFLENQTLSPAGSTYTVAFTPTKAGTYTVRGGLFTANWASNLFWSNTIATVVVSDPAPVVATPAVPVVTVPTVPTTPATPAPVTPTTPSAPETPAAPATPAPVSQPVVQAKNVSVWWPSNGSSVTGTQPFKAVFDGVNLNSYVMYWQVDGGTLNVMNDSQTDAPHKESLVNVSPWNWRANRTYTLTFVAKSLTGETLAQKSSVITVGY